MAKLKFNHAYDLGFEVLSSREDAEDVTPAKLRRAIRKRLREMSDAEIMEACNRFDTMRRDA